ncbi:MAG TPA: type II secretion system protein GspE [Elusimicrobia bacterium]|nr:type II secretion system protein GspE [Elusimicrobiota bacterium]
MTETWRFKDEWILRVLAGIKGADEVFIAAARAEKKTYLSHALVDAGILTAEQLGKAVELTFKVSYLPLAPENADRFGLKLVQEKTCRKYLIMPVGVSEEEIRLAMAAPLNLDAQSDVEAVTGRRVIPFFSMPLAVESCLKQLFNSDNIIYDLLNKVESPDEIEVLGGEISKDETIGVSAPIIKLVNSIISQAYRKHSSDIHLEHEEKASHVRIRVDGVLKTIMTIPRHIAAGSLVSRIKIMADLDVSNHMRPQDGRAKLRIGGAEVGLRVSTLPTSYGEKVVMRILDQRAAEVPFEKLGFAPAVSSVIETCLQASQGIILVTGPTGSGKTTTLYSILNKTRSEKTNIVTVEDPIEYKLAGINQVQVNEKQGLTFSAVLRSVLRQDPDIIMVGEIRDRETADIAFQAAMTGHMVFSTLHTNDSVSTIGRLTDMGLDRFKISPALLAITAQRLVRRLCPVCAEKVPESGIDPALLEAMVKYGFEKSAYRGPGCKNCEGSGYVGRIAMVEILRVTPRIKDLVNSGAGAAEITRAALEEKALRTLTHDALWHLSKGHTDLAEISPYITIEKKTAAAERAPAPAAAPEVLPQPAPAAGAASGRLRIMIADDDAAIRVLLKKFIEGAGYQVVETVDGEDALTTIASGVPPDMLVSDIHMPKMSGLELVKGVRETLGLADMPVIMLTTESSDKSQELAFKLGADDYIIKPFKAPLVIARINAGLRRAGKIR